VFKNGCKVKSVKKWLQSQKCSKWLQSEKFSKIVQIEKRSEMVVKSKVLQNDCKVKSVQ